MLGIDTNVLVRYLVQDDPEQSVLASNWIQEAISEKNSIYLNQIVFCELIWVLQGCYKVEKRALCETVEKILLAKEFEIESKDQIWQALSEFKVSAVDFVDALIAAKNLTVGCKFTATFDKRAAKKLKHFKKL